MYNENMNGLRIPGLGNFLIAAHEDPTDYEEPTEGVHGVLAEFLNGTVRRYSTIEAALAEGDGNTNATGNVLSCKHDDELVIMLLGDVTASGTIEIGDNCTIHLNGRKLSFGKGNHLLIKSGNVTIDGTVPGSEITKNVASNSHEFLVRTQRESANLQLVGGTYSMYGGVANKNYFVPIYIDTSSSAKMVGCTIKADASCAYMYGCNIKAETTICNCTVYVCNRAGLAACVYVYDGKYNVNVCDSILKTRATADRAAGVWAEPEGVTLENCIVSTAPTSGVTLYDVYSMNGYPITEINCHKDVTGLFVEELTSA